MDHTSTDLLQATTQYASSYPSYQLGKYIDRATALFHQVGFAETVRRLRTPNDFPDTVKYLPHKASRFLDYLRTHGAPAKMKTAPWSRQRCDAAIERGPHQSAIAHSSFLNGEMCDMADKGQWMVLPYDLVRHIPQLRISPLGIVPQAERRPRTIVDLSFFGVNQDTVPLAPSEAMQFGRALQRLLQKLVNSDPRHGPVYLIKVDISDGFYRIHVTPGDVPSLAVSFPPAPDGRKLVAFPMALPMGWVLSPPYFSAVTETGADLANQYLASSYQPGPHRLESMADAPDTADPPPMPPTTVAVLPTPVPLPPPSTAPSVRRKPLEYVDIYVDDFVALAQGGPARRQRVRRTLFHTIDQVLRPLHPSDPPTRQEPISEKKLRKGDARWSTRKVILGWVLDTVAQTIELPERRLLRLQEILASVPPTKKRISTKAWHQVLGELRSMVLAIPGLKGMFSVLQEALRHQSQRRIRLTRSSHDFLDDIRYLAQDLHNRPTRFREIVPTPIQLIGACDAAKAGMGGVFFPPNHAPCLWRAPFPLHIQEQVVSFDNPHGAITNSDLELAGILAQHNVIASSTDVREQTIGTLTDNTPALAWQTKGSTTTTGPAAYLLRLQALHQRHHRYLPRLAHIAGRTNSMADDCSRLWHLSDHDLLTHFNSTYPQNKPWRLCPLPSASLSSTISALQSKRPDPAFLRATSIPMTPVGTFGSVSATPSRMTPISNPSKTLSSSYRSSPPVSATATSPATQWDMLKLLPALGQWGRRLPSWGPLTRA